ncbi:MAG: cyclic nucleotide-binding domain-containing protein [Lachnospiraceae bacterium]|nr:cyclic nucleotide-binding domain-containing protein [Lachnospiraceae bacterium]
MADIKANSMNLVPAGEVLFEDGSPLIYIFMVVKGKVEFTSGGVKLALGVGSFLGLSGIASGTYVGSCRTLEPSSLYAFRFDGVDSVSRMLSSNKDYNGIAIFYQNKLITEMNRNYRELLSCAGSTYLDIKDQFDFYVKEAGKYGCLVSSIPGLTDLKEYIPQKVPDVEKVQYYTEFSRVPLETIKTFYTVSAFMTKTHINEQLHVIGQLLEACDEILTYVENVFNLLVASTENSLFKAEINLSSRILAKGGDNSAIASFIEYNYKKLQTLDELIRGRTASGITVDKATLENYYACFKSGSPIDDDTEEAAVDIDTAAVLATLADSAEQILTFAAFSEAELTEFLDTLNAFIDLPDKEAQDDDIRKLRKKISEQFYKLYHAVFMTSLQIKSLPKPVDLFLNYGYVSEKLLDQNQLAELVSLKQPAQCGECRVYTMREWLTRIYNGEEMPSRNDMGLDYTELLRERKKNKEIDEAKEAELLEDGNAKLEHEIKNVFMPANRVVNGQLSIFVPWLYKEAFMASVRKGFVDRERINQSYNELSKIDYSVFYRESLYTDIEAGIEREYEQKKVPPVFVLFPIVGLNGIMWQEITGRRRDSEGKFFFPMFTYSNLNDMMIKVFGQFRWALCKTIQGTNWNNIQVRSLTSEYSDYIQFYKKNHNLSDDRKEKLKLQIQRGRNNLREIFTLDYISWIQNESNGAVRMNKVAREILATYCPFAYKIRKELIKQPLYEEAFARGLRERAKEVRAMELRFKGLETKKVVIPEVLLKTLEFYRAY